jgi:hypothetical protein
MTGHGNVVFSDAEISNLNKYMVAGGFLHIDDNYGMDQYIRKEIKKNFNNALIEIPSNHILFQNLFFFPVDCPKSMNMTESDRRPTVFSENRLVLLYTLNAI